MTEIEEIRTYYKKLALLLHLRPSDIEAIEHEHGKDTWKALYAIISEWLKWNFDDTTENGKYPTRRWIVKAIKEIKPELADKLKKKYKYYEF